MTYKYCHCPATVLSAGRTSLSGTKGAWYYLSKCEPFIILERGSISEIITELMFTDQTPPLTLPSFQRVTCLSATHPSPFVGITIYSLLWSISVILHWIIESSRLRKRGLYYQLHLNSVPSICKLGPHLNRFS